MTVSKPRKRAEAEETRLSEARERAGSVCSLPIGRSLLAMLLTGEWAGTPLSILVTSSSACCLKGSTPGTLLQGTCGTCSMELQFTWRLSLAPERGKACGVPRSGGSKTSGTTRHALHWVCRRRFKELGFCEREPWHWQLPQP